MEEFRAGVERREENLYLPLQVVIEQMMLNCAKAWQAYKEGAKSEEEIVECNAANDDGAEIQRRKEKLKNDMRNRWTFYDPAVTKKIYMKAKREERLHWIIKSKSWRRRMLKDHQKKEKKEVKRRMQKLWSICQNRVPPKRKELWDRFIKTFVYQSTSFNSQCGVLWD